MKRVKIVIAAVAVAATLSGCVTQDSKLDPGRQADEFNKQFYDSACALARLKAAEGRMKQAAAESYCHGVPQ
jgi:uncharacterized lipoprotein